MNESSVIKAKIELELAIVKELYKNEKIGLKEYEYVKNKLEKKLEMYIVPKGLIRASIDIVL
jgi:hypothetical protein